MTSLDTLASQENNYQPSADVKKQLQHVHLVCLVGGVGVGKNYLMKASGLPVVGRVTSRPPRPDDDPKVYKYFTNDELVKMIEGGELVQYAVDLSNNVIYGSLPGDYIQDGPTLADIWHWSVDMLKNKGFGSVKAISIITPWEQWQEQLEERFENRDAVYKAARLGEALKSLEWTRRQLESHSPDHAIIINDRAQTTHSVEALRIFASGGTVPNPSDAVPLINSLMQHLSQR